MKHLILVFTILLSGTVAVLAENGHNLQWQKGNRFYEQKQYDSAAYYYSQIAALKPDNAEIYYNLGNTYYRLNKIEKAVLNYERALKADPDYKEAKENLALTQSRISNRLHSGNDIFFIQWWNSITRADKAATWSAWAFVTFAAFMLILFLRKFSMNFRSKIPIQAPGIVLLVFFCFLVIAFAAAQNSVQRTGAVVMQNDAPLMNPDLKGKPILLIPLGTTVKIKNENGEWLEVSLPDGRTGWLRLSLVEKI